jgi:hypothetical protein
MGKEKTSLKIANAILTLFQNKLVIQSNCAGKLNVRKVQVLLHVGIVQLHKRNLKLLHQIMKEEYLTLWARWFCEMTQVY